jgi:hypothetical protein
MGRGWRRRGSTIEARVTVNGKVQTRTFPGTATDAEIQEWRNWASLTGRIAGRSVALGVLADRHGYRVQVSVYGANVTRRFPADTPLAVVEAYAEGVRAARDMMKVRADHATMLADAIRATAVDS